MSGFLYHNYTNLDKNTACKAKCSYFLVYGASHPDIEQRDRIPVSSPNATNIIFSPFTLHLYTQKLNFSRNDSSRLTATYAAAGICTMCNMYERMKVLKDKKERIGMLYDSGTL